MPHKSDRNHHDPVRREGGGGKERFRGRWGKMKEMQMWLLFKTHLKIENNNTVSSKLTFMVIYGNITKIIILLLLSSYEFIKYVTVESVKSDKKGGNR